MPLTPEDVQEKQFSTVRLKEGYDMEEVDDFLDEVQAELERLRRENDELRDKLAAVTRGGGLIGSAEPLPARSGEGPKPAPMMPPAAEAPPVPASQGQPSEAAAKVLALAQRTADELVADAKAEADRLLTDARQRAEKIDAEIKAKVSKLEAEARQKVESIEREAAQRKQDVFGALEQECAQLERRRDELRDFEREYRSRLKAYLQSELRKLETGAVDEVAVPMAAAAPAGAPQPVGAPNPATGQNPNSNSGNSSAATTGGGGSGRSVASLLEDDQR
ncbi:MAG TPA: DivIVA domain-containing protein [Jiangellales bacterium]|nr:DivIVA domain-containing protein [Jiangellales bacterium]